MRNLLFLVMLLSVVFGCKKAENDNKLEQAVSMAPMIKSEAAALEVADDNMETVTDSTVSPKIIKTAVLRYESADINQSFATIEKAVKDYKASVQNDESGKDYSSSYRNVTVRVPSTSFDAFIAAISRGVNHFDRKEISAQDVTEEYVDVEARLKAKRILEKRYFELLNKATKVSEMLEIEKELSAIREEIEAKEGRLNYLQHQVSMSTVTLEMYTNNPSESGATVSYFGKMGNALKDGFNNIATFFIGLLQLWPFILIFVVMILFIRRRFKKKKT